MAKKRRKQEFQGIGDAELRVLRVLWEEGEATPSELREHLATEEVEWAYTTVQTLLHRLLDKRYVERRKEGVASVYRAAITRDELVAEHMGDLAERVGDGKASSLVYSLVRGKHLSKREITQLRNLLDETQDGKG